VVIDNEVKMVGAIRRLTMTAQLFILLALLLIAQRTCSLSSITIKVCQNKDCCKRYSGKMDLVQTLNNLLPDNDAVRVESSSCLSHCGEGPNIEIEKGNGETTHVRGVESALIAAAQLELTLGSKVPSLLVAACQVLERAIKGTCFVNIANH
jgi:hypothetical protein